MTVVDPYKTASVCFLRSDKDHATQRKGRMRSCELIGMIQFAGRGRIGSFIILIRKYPDAPHRFDIAVSQVRVREGFTGWQENRELPARPNLIEICIRVECLQLAQAQFKSFK